MRAGVIDKIPKKFQDILGCDFSARINTFISDLVYHSINTGDISMSGEIERALYDLRSYMFDVVYTAPVKFAPENVKMIIEKLYGYYEKHTNELPMMYRKNLENFETCDVICDFIAGMSDKYAIHLFQELFMPHDCSD